MKKKYKVVLYDLKSFDFEVAEWEASKYMFANNFLKALYYKFYLRRFKNNLFCKTKIFRNDLEIIDIN